MVELVGKSNGVECKNATSSSDGAVNGNGNANKNDGSDGGKQSASCDDCAELRSGGSGGAGGVAGTDLTVKTDAAIHHGVIVDHISPQVWRDAKLRIQRLLEPDVEQAERQQIATSLTDMCDRMETNGPRDAQLAVQLDAAASATHSMGATATTTTFADSYSAFSTSERFNERLRQRIAEFNRSLVSLADGISRLKNKLLKLELCATPHDTPPSSSPGCLRADSSIDVHLWREIHKNFRRILQKENCFLRDELFAARETIFRLERRGSSPSHHSDNADRQQAASYQLVPYQQPEQGISPPAFQPTVYFNTEHAAPVWPPHTIAAPFVTYPAPWERMYAHPELSRQLQSYDGACDLGLQYLLPQPVSSSGSNAVAIQQPDPSCWTPIQRCLADKSEPPSQQQRTTKRAKKK